MSATVTAPSTEVTAMVGAHSSHINSSPAGDPAVSSPAASFPPSPPPTMAAPALPPAVLGEHERAMAWAQEEAQLLAHGANEVSSIPLPSVSSVSRPMRVNGLDALALDGELSSLLTRALSRVFKHSGSWAQARAPELELALGAWVFAQTHGADVPTPGMKLQNVALHNHAAIAAARGPGVGAGAIATGLRAWIDTLVRGGGKIAAGGHRLDNLRSILPAGSLVPAATLSNFDAISSASSSVAAAAAATCVADPAVSATPSAVLLTPLSSSAPTLLSRRQKCLYFLGSVFARYAWSKLTHRMTMEGWGGAEEGSWQKRVYDFARRAEQAFQAAHILNFLVFLKQGCYRSLIERVLCLRLIYLRPSVGRALSFEFMNQQIAWSALSDFLLFLLPLINFGLAARAFTWFQKSLGWERPATSASDANQGCPVCHANPPVQPYRAQPCQHVYCYYCLAGNRLAAQQQHRGAAPTAATQYECAACQQKVQSQTPA